MITIDGKIKLDNSVWIDIALFVYGIEVEPYEDDEEADWRVARIDVRAKLRLEREPSQGHSIAEQKKVLKTMNKAFPHLRRLRLNLVNLEIVDVMKALSRANAQFLNLSHLIISRKPSGTKQEHPVQANVYNIIFPVLSEVHVHDDSHTTASAYFIVDRKGPTARLLTARPSDPSQVNTTTMEFGEGITLVATKKRRGWRHYKQPRKT